MSGRQTCTDKTWHAFHFLLAGTGFEGEPPFCCPMSGGMELPDSDDGCGRARILSPEEARDSSGALENTPREEMARRFDGRVLDEHEIYPTGLWAAMPDGAEYVVEHFTNLRALDLGAARTGRGILLMMN